MRLEIEHNEHATFDKLKDASSEQQDCWQKGKFNVNRRGTLVAKWSLYS